MIRAQDFDDFVELHYASVFWACRRHTPCVDTAWEAFQETYMAFLKRKDSLDLERDLEAWLRETARRCSLSVTRREHRQRSLDLASDSLENSYSEQGPFSPPSSAEREELLQILLEEFARLKGEDQVILRMVYQDSKSHRQIAKALNCPSGSVHSRVDSARTRLQKRMARRGVALAVLLWLLHLGEPSVFAGSVEEEGSVTPRTWPTLAPMAQTMCRALLIAASVVFLCVAVEQVGASWFDFKAAPSSNRIVTDGNVISTETESDCTCGDETSVSGV